MPFHFGHVLRALKEKSTNYSKERKQRMTLRKMFDACDEFITTYYAAKRRNLFEENVLESCQLIAGYIY